MGYPSFFISHKRTPVQPAQTILYWLTPSTFRFVNYHAHLSTKSNKRAAALINIKQDVPCKTTPTARVHIIRKENHSMRQSSN
jgi:hypothetical protein